MGQEDENVSDYSSARSSTSQRQRLGCLPKLIIWSLVIGFLYWLLFAPNIEISPPGGAGSEPDAVDGELDSEQQADYDLLAAQSDETPRVVVKDGAIRYLSVNVNVPDSVAVGALDKAFFFLEQNEGLFQIDNVRKNLRRREIRKGANGISYVDFVQEYQGVPVYGSTVTVGVSEKGEVTLVNGGYLPNLAMDVMPTIRSRDAENTALADFDHLDGKVALPTFLAIYSPNIFGDETNEMPRLIWVITLASAGDSKSTRVLYFMDARSGNIVESVNLILEVGGELYFEIYDAQGRNIPTDNLVWYEKGSSTYKAEKLSQNAVIANENLHTIYDYFWKTFGRDSYDNNGKLVTIVVDVVDSPNQSDQCRAYWHPREINGLEYIALCRGWDQAIDPIAHEYGHGVVAYTAKFVGNKGESGALSEAYGDLFAVFIDDVDPWRISNGETIRRNLIDPPGDYPRHYDQKKDSCGEDKDCVHANSVIFTHAAYLMHARGVPIQKLQHIFYRALTSGEMNSTTDMKSAANIVWETCHVLADDINFSPDITEEDCQFVADGFASTGLIKASSAAPPTLPPEILDQLKKMLNDMQQEIRDLIDQLIGDIRKNIEEGIKNLLEFIRKKIEEGIDLLIAALIDMLINAVNQFFLQLCGIPCIAAVIPIGAVTIRFRRNRNRAG